MSISIHIFLDDSVRQHPGYVDDCQKIIIPSTGVESTSGIMSADEKYSRRILERSGDLFVELRLEEGARQLPAWIPRSIIRYVSLVSTFNCRKLRTAGRYEMDDRELGSARGTLQRTIPVSEVNSVKADASFFYAVALIAENKVSLSGDERAVFDLYYQIRRGDIMPVEDWDQEQAAPA